MQSSNLYGGIITIVIGFVLIIFCKSIGKSMAEYNENNYKFLKKYDYFQSNFDPMLGTGMSVMMGMCAIAFGFLTIWQSLK